MKKMAFQKKEQDGRDGREKDPLLLSCCRRLVQLIEIFAFSIFTGSWWSVFLVPEHL